MCYSGNWGLVSPRELALRRRWHALQASMAAEAANHVHAPRVAAGDGGGPGKRYCMCSPTQHPGSFRCRQHHGEYAWGGGRAVRTSTNMVVQ